MAEQKLQRGFDFGIFKMAAVTMETAKIRKTSKCFKFIETYNKCCSANVDLTFEFGISKMAAVTMATAHLAIGEGCHPLLLAMANLVFIIFLPHILSRSFMEIHWTKVDGTPLY